MQTTDNSNECINWINESISKKLIKYYEYDHFYNVEEIGSGSFGKVYRANWKNSNKYLALKSFTSLNNTTAKEIVHEVIILKYVFQLSLYKNVSNLNFYLWSR